MIIHIWKIVNNISPNDIQIKMKAHPRLGIKLEIPPINKRATQAATTVYENSFAVKAAQLWNLLPPEVNSKTTLISFKKALGKFMETIPDQPPTVGCATAKKNSMTDWCNSQRGAPQFA